MAGLLGNLVCKIANVCYVYMHLICMYASSLPLKQFLPELIESKFLRHIN